MSVCLYTIYGLAEKASSVLGDGHVQIMLTVPPCLWKDTLIATLGLILYAFIEPCSWRYRSTDLFILFLEKAALCIVDIVALQLSG